MRQQRKSQFFVWCPLSMWPLMLILSLSWNDMFKWSVSFFKYLDLKTIVSGHKKYFEKKKSLYVFGILNQINLNWCVVDWFWPFPIAICNYSEFIISILQYDWYCISCKRKTKMGNMSSLFLVVHSQRIICIYNAMTCSCAQKDLIQKYDN